MKLKKILTLMCCAVLLVCISVGATVAYLTSQDTVTNTFSVGNIAITLDELDVDNSTEGENDRDKANAYHLLPSTSYVKDPTVHVAANSENSWLFVKVENGITAIETKDATKTIAAQIAANGWTALDGVANVYYKSYTKQGTVKDEVVFSSFEIAGDIKNATIDQYTNAKIVITAYAIQAQGLATAAEAWTAGGWN